MSDLKFTAYNSNADPQVGDSVAARADIERGVNPLPIYVVTAVKLGRAENKISVSLVDARGDVDASLGSFYYYCFHKVS